MGFDGDLSFLGTSFQVFLIDLLLSGDNAVVIALVCRSLPPRQARQAMLFGTAGAILLRIYLTTVVGYLLSIPGLKLVGAVALLMIAIKLMIEEEQEPKRRGKGPSFVNRDLETWIAVMLVVIADLVMSLDNVVALAAASRGSILFLGLGLILSIPLLMYGSLFVVALLKRYPGLITAGGALLGWLAGDIGMSDPVLADWINTQAPALTLAMPLLGAVFVVIESRIVGIDRKALTPMAEAPVLQSVAAAVALTAPVDGPATGGNDVMAKLARMAGRKLSRTKVADQPGPDVPTYRPPSTEEALAAGALILVAEDNPLDQGELKRSLELLGYAVETANDGRQALEMLGQRAYGLLITDCGMPNMDGYELTLQLRAREKAHHARLPIIGVVGYLSTESTVRKCLDAGMDDTLCKPMRRQTLDAAVRSWLPVAEVLRRQTPTVLEG